jgi:peptidoglycan hydrolase CwlO-like protein
MGLLMQRMWIFGPYTGIGEWSYSMQKHATMLRVALLWGYSLLFVVAMLLVNVNLAYAGRITKLNSSFMLPACPDANAPATKIMRVYKEVTVSPGVTQQVNEVELGDIITMEVQDFATLRDEAACTGKHIVLYLDERPLKDVTAFPPTDPTKSILRFPLNRTENSRETWTFLLGAPQDLNPRVTKVSIGIEDKFAVPSDASINLIVISLKWRLYLWLFILAVIVIVFSWLAWKTDVLRDSSLQTNMNERKPFSLARSQAAWWFFIILASYLFIGLITHDFSTTITGTVLVLLGISAGTAVGSAVIDATTVSPSDIQRQKTSASNTESKLSTLGIEIQTLEADIQRLNAIQQNIPATQTLTAKQKELGEKVTEKTKLDSKLPILEIEIQTLKAATQALTDKQTELAKKEAEKTELESGLSALGPEIQTLEADIQRLNAVQQNVPATQALTDKQTELAKKEAEKTELESKLSTLGADIQVLQADIQRLNAVVQQNAPATQVGFRGLLASIRPDTPAPATQTLAEKQKELDEKEAEKTKLESSLPTLGSEIQALQADITAAQQQNASATQTLAEKQKELDEKVTEKASLESQLKKLSNKSNNFFVDVLSDTAGVSFHRFQIFAWTIVLGIIFGIQVYSALAMPTFDATLLALLGISAGTYLGLKIPEGKNS